MKNLMATSQPSDRLRYPSVAGEVRLLIAASTVCDRARSVAQGHWLHTPKFGDYDYSQRWRCTA